MAYQRVTVYASPVSNRIFSHGMTGQISEDGKQIRIAGLWFHFDNKRWAVRPLRTH